MGGEKALDDVNDALEKGSPPRGRGKGHGGKGMSDGVRITPAWAGKSCSQMGEPISDRDHPRVGGEKSLPLGGDRR